MFKQVVLAAAVCWCILFCGVEQGDCASTAVPAAHKPLVVYYSRTGTSAVIAHEISERLSCPRQEVRSQKNRFYLGAFTCVLDQLLDRDDENEPSHINFTGYDSIIIISPVWLHILASPMRTYLKQHSIKNKTVYVIATNQGNYSPEKDEQKIREFLMGLGASVGEIRGIMTKGKAWEALRLEAEALISQSGLLQLHNHQ